LDDGARDGLERFARFGAKGGGAFEADKTEERQDHAETQTAAGHGAEMALLGVEAQAVAEKHQSHHEKNDGDGETFDPQHEPCGNFHVMPGDEHGDGGDAER
jgi:hypothetical protein